MATRIELSSGAWVELRDKSEIRQRDRKAVVMAGDSAGTDAAKGLAMAEALLRQVIEAWSFDLAVPSQDPASLDELSPSQYDELSDAVTASGVASAIFPEKTFEVSNDPKATSSNSNGTSGRRKATK